MLWLGVTTISYANLVEDEKVDIENIREELAVQTAKPIGVEPELTVKIGLIFDRKSKTILYEKNGQKQVPMASTTKI